MIVVDASVLIDHLRGRADARHALRQAVKDRQRVAASVLTRVEVTARMRSAERDVVSTLFRAIDWLPVTDAIAEDAGVLARQYRQSHGAIDVVDFVIAATARSHDAQVWTLNVRHFPMFEDIDPPY